MVVQAVPVRDFMQALAPRVGIRFRACGSARITGRFFVEVAADLEHAIREAGRQLTFALDGTWLVDCSAANQIANDPASSYVPSPSPQEALRDGVSIALGSTTDSERRAPYQPQLVAPGQRVDDTYRTVSTRYYGRSKFDPLSALGLKVLGDPDVPGPLMLVGAASIVAVAENYVRSVDICPRQLRLEATVVTRSGTGKRDRSMGLRLGNRRIGFGTAGTADSGLNFPLLSAFLKANRGIFEAATNATFRGRVLEGSQLKLTDGQDVPVRAATSVTDRETRQDVIYRTAGHQLIVKPVSLDDTEAVLMVDHSISALSTASDLGPSFSTRSTSSLLRVRYREPIILSISGADTARREKSRGILSRSDALESANSGAFLLLAVDLDRCGAAVGEDVQPKAAPQRSLVQ
ncbi:hypothetical protein [Sphingomonas sp.]|uniref:hypothetical protein n=1 Tax=Sphingomonas sp. TaxID=28214 RepID=UPI003D6D5FD8